MCFCAVRLLENADVQIELKSLLLNPLLPPIP